MNHQEPIFLNPALQERIWGGKKLKTLFGYDLPYEKTGEAWVISAHENGPSTVKNGSFAGKTLREVWENNPELFGKEKTDEDFPLLVKILDANDNLSVQVHPDDSYAQEVEKEPYGKTECWYVLDCEEDSEIVFGHQAASKEEFKQMVEENKWDELLTRIKVKPGDFFYVPSGTIHAIGEGIVILEIQQSSDITYRVYDYDRRDDDGNPRELHIDEAIDVTTFPHQVEEFAKTKETIGDLVSEKLIEEMYFTVYHWQLSGKVDTPLQQDYLLVSVIGGKGELIVNERSYPIEKGSHFILPRTLQTYEMKGDVEIVVSHETKKD